MKLTPAEFDDLSRDPHREMLERPHRDVGALAYARGNDVHLAPGQERHLPHEAWHVVQQREGRVAPVGNDGFRRP